MIKHSLCTLVFPHVFNFVLALLLAFGSPGQATAGAGEKSSQPMDQKAIYVDHDKIISSSDAFTKVRDIIEIKRKLFQKEIKEKEKKLRDLEGTLKSLEGRLNHLEFYEKRKAFEAEVEEVQRLSSEKRRRLDEAFHKARQKLIEEMMGIIATLCQEQKVSFVFPKSQLVYADERWDFTDDILKKLNTKFSSTDVEAFVSKEFN